jgi:hypothetical protein
MLSFEKSILGTEMNFFKKYAYTIISIILLVLFTLIYLIFSKALDTDISLPKEKIELAYRAKISADNESAKKMFGSITKKDVLVNIDTIKINQCDLVKVGYSCDVNVAIKTDSGIEKRKERISLSSNGNDFLVKEITRIIK